MVEPEPKVNKKNYKIYHHQLVDILVFTLILFLKMWVLGDFVLYGKEEFMLRWTANLLGISSLLLIGLTSYFMSRRTRIVYLISWDIILSLFLFLCVVYYRQFGDFPSWTMISLLSQLGDVKNSVTTLFSMKDFWLFLDPILAIIGFVLLRKKISSTKKFYSITHMFVSVIIFFFIFGVTGIATMELTGNYEKRNASRLVAVNVGFINYLAMDTANIIKNKIEQHPVSDERINEIAKSMEDDQPDLEKGEYFGIFKDKNALFVQLESYSGYLVDKEIGGQEITPNLNRLVSTSYYADDFYTEIAGGHSSDAELTSLTSLYPLDQESSFVMYGDNAYNSLASIFQSEGYHTFSAHAHRGDFWNRRVMHASLGFDESWFRDSYVQDDLVGMGISDESFMSQTVDKISNLKTPFLGYLITLESHTPFSIEGELKELDLGDLEGTKVGDYLQSVHHADKAIGGLIDALKEKGLYSNTVIVMYGDHDAEFNSSELQKWFPVTIDEEIYQKKVPFLIHDPSGSLKGTNHDIMGHVDIAPSILHLWGFKPQKTFFFGKNIFSPNGRDFIRMSQGHIVTNNYALINIDSTTDGLKAIDNKTHQEIPITPEMKKKFEQVKVLYEMSNEIIKGDLIERLGSP